MLLTTSLVTLAAVAGVRASYRRADTTSPHTGPSSGLLDLPHFSFLASPRPASVCTEELYLLVLVHSPPAHFKQRELIRQTWGGVTRVTGRDVRLLFLTGRHARPAPRPGKRKMQPRHSVNSIKSRSLNRNGFFKSTQFQSDRYKSEAVARLLRLESDLHGDIVQGDFEDAGSRNLTYKHVMGYKWVMEDCEQKPAFVLKTDDNVFVEMYHLLNFLTAVYGDQPAPSIVCDVIPAGTAPHNKPQDQKFLRKLESKRKSVYPKDHS